MANTALFSASIPSLRLKLSCLCQIAYLETRGDHVTETTPLAWATGQNKTQISRRVKLVKAVMYAGQTFYAFMLM